MRKMNFGVLVAMIMAVTGCAMTKKGSSGANYETTTVSTADSQSVQAETRNVQALNRATDLTAGWPQSSLTAAKEMIEKYGEPQETTSDKLIWRNIAPFKEIIVHKVVYSHKFPLLHQNALEHVVEYKAPVSKIDDVWNYNGSIVLNRNQGTMSSYADNEAMNILALNLADEVMRGRMSADSARVKFGKETLNFMNGNKTAYTSVLGFGGQYQTADQGETVTNKIRWIGDPDIKRSSNKANLRQAQEEK